MLDILIAEWYERSMGYLLFIFFGNSSTALTFLAFGSSKLNGTDQEFEFELPQRSSLDLCPITLFRDEIAA